ncbi:MAG TPA: hypothetical protein PLV68_07465, partial [Ilumatobacteraceae bacterium]|nr:hypothetical protein [Ilumatobacteraceae bacterium]
MATDAPPLLPALDRRRFVGLLATPVLASLLTALQACGSDTPATGNTANTGDNSDGTSVGLLRSDASRARAGD